MTIKLGQTVITAGVNALIDNGTLPAAKVHDLFTRQENCDWGECAAEDRELNDEGARTGEDRCMGVHTVNGIKLWIITEQDRSATTVLLPEEY